MVVLASDDDLVIDPQPCPEETREAQVSPLFRSQNIFARGRGNRAQNFQWKTLRDHDSDQGTFDFVWSHARLVPINIDAMLIQNDATDPGVTYTQGVIRRVIPVEWYGTSSTFLYEVVGAVPA